MIYAVISDIHANLEALDVVLADIRKRKVDKILCLGDIVGYNADPNECVRIVEDQDIPSLEGNHDAVACGKEKPWGFNPVALDAANWTRDTLTEENRDFLKQLPDDMVCNGRILAVHGAPGDRDTYLFTWEEIEPLFPALEERNVDLCLFGHTHFPGIFGEDGTYRPNEDGLFKLPEGKRFFINPGSVGQPRDADPRAAYALFNEDAREMRFVRLDYDRNKTAQKIVDSGLPPFLAERLMLGR